MDSCRFGSVVAQYHTDVSSFSCHFPAIRSRRRSVSTVCTTRSGCFTPSAVAAGDFNGDGKMDLIVGCQAYCTSGLAVLLGDGTGGFQTPARIIDDLLDLTRIARGLLSFSPENTDVHSLIEFLVGLSQSELQNKVLKLDLKLDAPRHHVYTDAARLQHALDAMGDLRGERLLHLQSARERLDHPRELADADDGAVGQ